MTRNLNFHSSNDLNVSNSSDKELDKELNDILTEDLLSYSEDKSQSILNQNQNQNQNNDNSKITNNKNSKNQEIKVPNIIKNDNNLSNNSEITISFLSSKNKSESQKCSLNTFKNDGKDNNKIFNDTNNNNGSNKDLSALQVSLSNLLSDIDSKDNYISQNNKIKELIKIENNINRNDNNNLNFTSKNEIINISNDNSNIINSTNAYNNNPKEKNFSHEEHSSSVCNYSQSVHTNNKQSDTVSNNILKNNENIKVIANVNNKNNNNNNQINIGTNFIINSNLYEQDKIKNTRKSLKYAKNKNIYNERIKDESKQINKKIKHKYQISSDDNNKKVVTPSKINYQIEKGENIQLSINKGRKTITQNYILKEENNNYSKIKSLLSINKTQNFTIDSTTSDMNNNISYDLVKKNNTTSMEIINEILENNATNPQENQNNVNKNKMKLINNKNIVILNDESKKFFYNPKTKYNSNDIFYINKNENMIINKIKNNLNNNNKNKMLPKKREKNIIYSQYNLNYTKIKSHNQNIQPNNKSFNKNIFKKDSINNKRAIFALDKKKCNSGLNSYNNSSNKKKKKILKVKNFTRNIDVNDINLKKHFSVKNKKKKLKSSNTDNNSNINNNNECITEPTKLKNKMKCNKGTNSTTHNLINKVKIVQKKASNELLNKITNLNNININIINKGNLFPIFSKVFQESSKSKNSKEHSGNNKEIKKKKTYQGPRMSHTTLNKNKINNNKVIKLNKNKCLTDDILNKKEKKSNVNDNQHKKINTQINLTSLLNNFNNKNKNRKNNKSLFNFGNIFFINQSQISKKYDSDILSSNIFDKSNNGINKEKIIIYNDNCDSSKLNTLNYSINKQRPQIINDFSNYKKKGNFKCKFIDKNSETNIERTDYNFKPKRTITSINNNIRHNLNTKMFKVIKVEGDNGSDLIKGI